MKSTPNVRRAAAICAVSAIALASASPEALARRDRRVSHAPQVQVPNPPLLAIVALKEQRVSIYDATGKILEAPVSTGQSGLETPAGIYSVVQKEEEHHSNIYDDASMPFMERITWTGIALHAGVLPGYPASHGCVRMPIDFADRLYGQTNLGMRVIIVREDIAPVAIAQPAVFTPEVSSKDEVSGGQSSNTSPAAASPAAIPVSGTPGDAAISSGSATQIDLLKAAAAAKSAAARTAAVREKDLRQASVKIAAEAAAAVRTMHAAEAELAKAEADANAADRPTASAAPAAPGVQTDAAKAEAAKAKAVARFEAAQALLKTATVEVRAKADSAARAQDEAKAALTAKNAALDAAEAASQNLSPVSVFISRKSQRLYVRKGNLPVFEGPVAFRDADTPLGTFVYTALDYSGTPGVMNWNVVSMYKNAAHVEPYAASKSTATKVSSTKEVPPAEAAPADIAAAQAVLTRLIVPKDASALISEVVLPGSSLIVSDESYSNETGKDTDFVVVMSGEPQGGMTIRKHDKASRPADRYRYDDRRAWRLPFFFFD